MKFPLLLRPAPLLLLLAPLLRAANTPASEPPTDWIDPDTGHRVVQLDAQAGSGTLYFHQDTYTPGGDKLIFNTPAGIAMVEVKSIGTPAGQAEVVVPDASAVNMSRRTREVYFTRGHRGGRVPGDRDRPTVAPVGSGSGASGIPLAPSDAARSGFAPPPPTPLLAANLDTKAVREVPNATSRNSTVNADETFAVTTVNAEDPTGKTPKPVERPHVPQMERMFPGKKPADLTPDQLYAAQKEDGLSRRVFNPDSMAFVFTNLKTGAQQTVGYQYAWLNHMQFNPVDPTLLLYCHEGTWHEVDRVWTIRTDGSEQVLRHRRTMDMEIAGHEFWSHDGRTIWFDLQTPRSQDFWIGGVNLDTGKETRYHLERDWWSVHYNVSWDGRLFGGDGGDSTQVAFAKDGMWINLFTPQPDGSVVREKLVNMAKHNYVTGKGGVEPNLSITPDDKWVVFTGNFFGPRHVYAVEIAKAAPAK
jgi:oligogalacturonide lyase